MYCVIYAMFLLTDFRDVFNKTRGVEFNSVKFDQIKIFLPQIGKENYFSNFGKTKRFLAKFGKEEKLYPKIGKKSVKEKPQGVGISTPWILLVIRILSSA